jgi:hypothetical protein
MQIPIPVNLIPAIRKSPIPGAGLSEARQKILEDGFSDSCGKKNFFKFVGSFMIFKP